MNRTDETEIYGFFTFIFAIVIVINFPVWVTDDAVTPRDYEHAQLICEANDGLRYIEFDYQYHDVVCNNGVEYEDAFAYGDANKFRKSKGLAPYQVPREALFPVINDSKGVKEE